MADDDQAPVQVVMDGQEQEVLAEDVNALARSTIQQLKFLQRMPMPSQPLRELWILRHHQGVRLG